MRYFFDDDHEHPVVAVIAVIAIFLAMLLIAWARYELQNGNHETYEIEAAATANRFATGFSP
jgi:hypothetical protein